MALLNFIFNLVQKRDVLVNSNQIFQRCSSGEKENSQDRLQMPSRHVHLNPENSHPAKHFAIKPSSGSALMHL